MPDLPAPIAFRTFLISDYYDLTPSTPFHDSVVKMCNCSSRIDKGNQLGPTEYIITTTNHLDELKAHGDLCFLTDVAYNISNLLVGAWGTGILGHTAKHSVDSQYTTYPGLMSGYLYWQMGLNRYQGENKHLNGFEAFMGHVLAHERLAHAFHAIIPDIFYIFDNWDHRPTELKHIDDENGLMNTHIEDGNDSFCIKKYVNYDYVANTPVGVNSAGLIEGEFTYPDASAPFHDKTANFFTRDNIRALRRFAECVRAKGKSPGIWDDNKKFFSVKNPRDQDLQVFICAFCAFHRFGKLPWYREIYKLR